MYPRYNLLTSGSQKFLLVAQKMNIVGTAHYIITTNQREMTRMSEGYVGKLRSDTSGNEYNLFGVGENPDKGLTPEKTRNQLAGIYYVNSMQMIGTYKHFTITKKNGCCYSKIK